MINFYKLVFSSIIIGTLFLKAEPSGGPYGPIRQTYELPEVKGKIYYVAPYGRSGSMGESIEDPTTLEAAIERVKTGDAIIMRGGIYRTGNLMLNQGIIIQPYKDEQPILKGTYIANDWENLGNGLWKTKWKYLFPSEPADWWQRQFHGKETPLHRFNNDVVFVDGKFLQSVGWEGEVNENTFFIDYVKEEIYIGVDPKKHLIEITAFPIGIMRTTGECHGKSSDKRGPIIRGITFTQYASRAIEIEGVEPESPSHESKYGKEVIGTILENCEISNCGELGAKLRGDSLVVRHCKVSNTSTEGLYIVASSDVLLERNIFTQNNIERITGYYPAAVKIFNQCHRVICRDNLVIDLPYSNGIWYDVGNVDGVFVNNWVQNVGILQKELPRRYWPTNNGFFFEISKGVICAGNVFVNCEQGIFILNSSGAQIYQNTFINSTVNIGRTGRTPATDRLFGWHSATGPDVEKREGHIFVNNLLVGDENFNRPLFISWQEPSLCRKLKKPQLKKMDYNVYIRKEEKSEPLILWGPIENNEECQIPLRTPKDLSKIYKDFSTHSLYFLNYRDPIFRSWELGNYQLLKNFPNAGTILPEEVKKFLGDNVGESPFVGAYPPGQ
ncbi:MAG: right-handed parallel beta-helix repeat-containing protein [candidate division WOR-3 bacterium]